MQTLEELCKTPPAGGEVTFYMMAYDSRTEEEMMSVVESLDVTTDYKMLEVIFKRCRHHRPRLLAGKRMYYISS